MKQELAIHTAKAAVPSPDGFDLGTWLGRRQAFGMMAGKSAAADAECLRQIRDRKLYKNKSPNWDEFCTRYIGASRANVNRVIRNLEEFGPEFFELSQLTRIPPEAYRGIAPYVGKDGLHLDGEVIAIVQENSQRVSGAVAELRKRSESEGSANRAPAAQLPPPQTDPFESLEKHLDEMTVRVQALPALDPRQKILLAGSLMRLRKAAVRAGVQLILT
jgi:hypothetical protein